MENKTFCVLPWIHIATRPDGTIKPCCVSTDIIKKENGEKYNLGYDSFDDIYNGPEFREIRRRMIAGEKISGCETCYRQEESSNHSKRLLSNKEFFSNSTVEKSKLNDYKIEPIIKYIDLRFGNLCNLKCRSCIPVNSSQLNKEISELEKTPLLNKIYPVVTRDINQWYTTDQFFDNLSTTKKYLRTVTLTGGEPTLVEGNYKYMQMLIDEGSNKNIMLVFNTNLTNIQNKFLDYCNKFRWILFSCSIDGVGSMQEYLRYPSSWKQIDVNFKKLTETTRNREIRLHPVVQITNLEYISELFEYAEQINRSHGKKIINICPELLNHPSIMDIQYLPLDYKQHCWKKLSQWLTTVEFQNSDFFEKMKQIEYRCNLDIKYREQLLEFKEITLTLDKNRNQTLKDVNPTLWNILSTL